MVVVFTGSRHGKRAGYPDRRDSDGTFLYGGQGTVWSQRFAGANRILLEQERTVLLFHTWRPPRSWKGWNRFAGVFLVARYRFEGGRGRRAGDELLVVTLAPARPTVDASLAPEDLEENLNVLRTAALGASRETVPAASTLQAYRHRSDIVTRHVLAWNRGRCKMCERPAPLITPPGAPYLEAHHTQWLADDGPDDLFRVGAVCPNCHREAHHGPNPENFRSKLETRIARNEAANPASSDSSSSR